ncbi:MAG: hypothetical protein R3F14_21900 [Polyangiaceae bacterium]
MEAVRALEVLPDDRASALHESYVGELTKEEARAVAAAIRERLLPTLAEGERLLLDGQRTTEPDDGTFYRGEDADKNYSTTRDVLERFAEYCESCDGFTVC